MYSKQCQYGSKEVVGLTQLCHRSGEGAVRAERENGSAAMARKARRHEEGMKIFLFSFALLCF